MEGNGAQVDQALDLLLGILHVQKVIVVVFRIDPDVGRDHLIRRKGGNDVLYDLLFAEPQLSGASPVDFEPQRRIIEVLRDIRVRDSANSSNLFRQVERGLVAGLKVGPAHLNVDRGGKSQVQDGIDQTA